MLNKQQAFTLAELLIVLALLGIIAAFALPKLLQNSKLNQYNAMAKEAAMMVGQSYSLYQQNSVPSTTTRPRDLVPYMNGVSRPGGFSIDNGNGGTMTCNINDNCLQLHSGAILAFASLAFPGTDPLAFMIFIFDPDGVGSEPALRYALYFNGQMTDWGHLKPGSYSGYGPATADPTRVASWFKWD